MLITSGYQVELFIVRITNLSSFKKQSNFETEDDISKEVDDEIGEDEEEEEVTIKYEVKNHSSTARKLLLINQSPSMKRLYQCYVSNIVFLDATYHATPNMHYLYISWLLKP